MASPRLNISLGSGLALAAATVTLPVLVYVGLSGNNQHGNNQNGKSQNGNNQVGNSQGDNQNGNPPVSMVPEANAGWVLVPFFGAVLLYSWRQVSRAKP